MPRWIGDAHWDNKVRPLCAAPLPAGCKYNQEGGWGRKGGGGGVGESAGWEGRPREASGSTVLPCCCLWLLYNALLHRLMYPLLQLVSEPTTQLAEALVVGLSDPALGSDTPLQSLSASPPIWLRSQLEALQSPLTPDQQHATPLSSPFWLPPSSNSPAAASGRHNWKHCSWHWGAV